MHLLYADEFGHDGVWDPCDPKHAHHPLFGLAGFCISAENWWDFDRGYLRLKKKFYDWEIKRAVGQGMRPERFEVKNLSNRRDIRFAFAVMQLIRDLGGHAFAHGREKPVGFAHDSIAFYGSITQGLMRSFERYLRERDSLGMIIIDRRSEHHDVQLLRSMQSYMFSSGCCDRLVETPMLVRSEWHHGVQAADTVARCVGKVFRHRVTGDAAHQSFDRHLGESLDKLTANRGAARPSVWVQSVAARSVPPTVPPSQIIPNATPVGATESTDIELSLTIQGTVVTQATIITQVK